jgi:DNA-binding XRE family transcriptional regulator
MSKYQFVCLYCDDVRREVGEKISYIGVYENSIIFQEKPAHKPLMSFALKLSAPFEHDFDQIEFEITDDEELNFTGHLTAEDIKQTKDNTLSNLSEPPENVIYNCVIQVGGLKFSQKRKIRSFARFDNTVIEGPSLEVLFRNDRPES